MRSRTLIAIVLAAALWTGGLTHAADGRTVEQELGHLLGQQAAAWNRGDLEAFCSVYAADALFASPSGLTRGRDEVLARYRASYPDQAAMGTLSLDVIEVRELSDTGASVVARWRLVHEETENAEGLTLLTFERTDAGWSIVHDASFSAASSE
jgi:uncharacterized protein (TIGR02246 family)